MGQAGKRTRHNRTITVDFPNEATYFQLLGDGKAFVECVMAFLLALGFQLAHKATCHGGGCLTRHSHYIRLRLGGVTIWSRRAVPATTSHLVVGAALLATSLALTLRASRFVGWRRVARATAGPGRHPFP